MEWGGFHRVAMIWDDEVGAVFKNVPNLEKLKHIFYFCKSALNGGCGQYNADVFCLLLIP